jgi:6-phosphogluconolactonase
MTEIRTLPDADAVAREAAGLWARLAADAIAERGRFAVALSGGATPRRLYEVLAEPPLRSSVAWERVEFFWGDERAVPPAHPDSNYRMARLALLDPLAVDPARIHRLEGERADLDAAARDYEAEIARVLGGAPGAPPAFDLVLLGLGRDAHTASLFPGTAALAEARRWVVAHFVPALGANRLTFTFPLLAAAAHVVFLVAGSDKALPVAEVLEGAHDPSRLPAQGVRPASGRLVWLLDRHAAGKLSVGSREGRA